jgi:hypothetical protein
LFFNYHDHHTFYVSTPLLFEMVEKAKALLTHIAETYLEKATPSSTMLAPSTHTNAASELMPVKSSSFMDDACYVKVVELQVLETTLTPLELLTDEIKHYTEFQSGKGNLQKPLACWKVKLCSPQLLLPVIFLPSLQPVSLSSERSPSPAISALFSQG